MMNSSVQVSCELIWLKHSTSLGMFLWFSLTKNSYVSSCRYGGLFNARTLYSAYNYWFNLPTVITCVELLALHITGTGKTAGYFTHVWFPQQDLFPVLAFELQLWCSDSRELKGEIKEEQECWGELRQGLVRTLRFPPCDTNSIAFIISTMKWVLDTFSEDQASQKPPKWGMWIKPH